MDPRRNRAGLLAAVIAVVVAVAGSVALAVVAADGGKKWKVHDEDRPRPKIVTPGSESTPQQPGKPPSDAIVLFDGKDLSKWKSARGGGTPGWKVENGELVIVARSGDILTTEQFGDCQLHVEWAAPTPAQGASQGRGNSGIKLMGRYEVQVLDSYENQTYADGQAGSLYGQTPPLVNASRPPGQWQTFDLIFHAPRFSDDGKLTRPGTVTLLHNGVLVQDHAELTGATGKAQAGYSKHAEKLPLLLQEHGNPVRYRNIWIRPLTDERP
jgi:hypothetical protein